MNDRTAVTIYGIVGQPAGTVIGDDLFDADGNQVAFIEGGLLFSADDGEWFGSYVNGVIYNAYCDAEGFREGATEAFPMIGPSVHALPPRLKATGPVVRHGDRKILPEFFARAQRNRRSKVFG